MLKTVTDALTDSDKSDLPGNVYVVDDLIKMIVPVTDSNLVEVKPVYTVPDEFDFMRTIENFH